MDAIVLVGGQGTRLRPLTAARHKSLVPICNRPAIDYLFSWLRESGIRRVVLALGLANEDLAEAYPAGNRDGMEFVTIFEKQRLESGGAIRYAVEQAGITGRFLVLNGDVYMEFDFRQALAAHESAGALVTLALSPVEDPSQFGVAVMDDAGWIRGFHEKPPLGQAPSNLVNAGAWIFEPAAVGMIPAGAVRVEETLFPSLAERGRLFGHVFEGPWEDIGTPQRYLALNQLLAARSESTIATGCIVEPTAVFIASSLGPGSVVGQRTVVEGSILWERVTISDDVSVRNSILADGVTVEAGATIERAVVGHGATICAGAVVSPGTIIQPGSRVDGASN
jgi:mannose-1-phosphate guanylyltransferase